MCIIYIYFADRSAHTSFRSVARFFLLRALAILKKVVSSFMIIIWRRRSKQNIQLNISVLTHLVYITYTLVSNVSVFFEPTITFTATIIFSVDVNAST